jgi:hypothetical protein
VVIIALSGFLGEENADWLRECAKKGFTNFACKYQFGTGFYLQLVAKPISKQELLALIREWSIKTKDRVNKETIICCSNTLFNEATTRAGLMSNNALMYFYQQSND